MSHPVFTVVGASSWIGHYLIACLKQMSAHSELIALNRNQGASLVASLAERPRTTLIYLARGESQADYETLLEVIEHQNKSNGRLIYASSANVFDADGTKPHDENDPPQAQSDYGKFKLRCEQLLLERAQSPVIFRLAATHGWAPNRTARTEAFLQKLKAGQRVTQARGVFQNRSFVGDLAKQIAMLALSQDARGVYHLGTEDSADEVDFLRGLATAFGYDAASIVEVGQSPWNATVQVGALKLLFPRYQVPTEADTISQVSEQLELAVYKK